MTPGKLLKLNLRGIRKDTSDFPTELHLHLVTLQDQTLIGCTIRDISKRVSNETAIRNKEKKLQMALQGAELWIREFDLNMKIINYELQYSSGDFSSGKTEIGFDDWMGKIHPEDRTLVDKVWSSFIDERTNEFEIEYRIQRGTGSWDWIYSTGAVSDFDENGHFILSSGTNLNISERKYAEQRLQEKNESLLKTQGTLRLAQESAGVASWERDMKLSRLSYYSDNLAGLYGL